jgi:AmmeMemoRadiSam system protein A
MTPDPQRTHAEQSAPIPNVPAPTPEEKRAFLSLARRAITESLQGRGEPEADLHLLPAIAAIPLGCFVTLTLDGNLKGCIGSILPRLPLHRAITRHALQAAFEDRRFEPVLQAELGRLRVEISILSPLRPLRPKSPQDLIALLHPHEDGVFLKLGGLGATYLPQVWRDLPDPAAFLDSLARKAGLSTSGWKDPRAEISTYRVVAFAEGDAELAPQGLAASPHRR